MGSVCRIYLIMFLTMKYVSRLAAFSSQQWCSTQHLYLVLIFILACKKDSTMTRSSSCDSPVNTMIYLLFSIS